jgi:hypothetical protein
MKKALYLAIVVFLASYPNGAFAQCNGSSQGNLHVNSAAAMEGQCGLEITVSGDNQAYVVSDDPESEDVFRAYFRFNPNNITMARGQSVNIINALSNNPSGGIMSAFRVVLKRKGSGFYLRVKNYYNTGKKLNSPLVYLGPPGFADPVEVGVQWWAGDDTTPEGYCQIRVNGGAWSSVWAKNKLLRIENVLLGFVLGSDPTNTTGSLYFDDFQSYRTLLP